MWVHSSCVRTLRRHRELPEDFAAAFISVVSAGALIAQRGGEQGRSLQPDQLGQLRATGEKSATEAFNGNSMLLLCCSLENRNAGQHSQTPSLSQTASETQQ